MIVYTIEKIFGNVKLLRELNNLAKLHYKEVAPYEDIPLSINWNEFLGSERLGYLKVYTARKDTKLVGYAVFIVDYSAEYSESFQASLSNIFIHPDHRGHGNKFIAWCDEQLKELGVQVVYHHVKAKNNYGVLLKRLGYDIMNIEYAKRLDK